MIESIFVKDIGNIEKGQLRWNLGTVEKIEQINETTYVVYVDGKIKSTYNIAYVIEVVYPLDPGAEKLGIDTDRKKL